MLIAISNNMSKSLSLFSYPDDEGIKINKGRPGANLGPKIITQYLQKSKKDFWPKNIQLTDKGCLQTQALNLEQKHNLAITNASLLVKNYDYNIFLGGGHDYAYPDGLAFLKEYKNQKPVIINIDAHLDVRPTDKGCNSGTPFYRLLCEHKNEFEFWEIGIQKQCNSKAHWDWCVAQGGHIISNDQLLDHSPAWSNYVLEQINIKPDQNIYLSIDIDGFSSSYAQGCSQSWPLGILPHEFFKFLNLLMQKASVKCMGIYEVSPPLDVDDKTSKLAVQIIHHFVKNLK